MIFRNKFEFILETVFSYNNSVPNANGSALKDSILNEALAIFITKTFLN